MFVFILFSCSFCCFSFFKQVSRDIANSSEEEISGKGSLLQCHNEISLVELLTDSINLTCKILSCCDYFLRLLRGVCVVFYLFSFSPLWQHQWTQWTCYWKDIKRGFRHLCVHCWKQCWFCEGDWVCLCERCVKVFCF